MRQDIDSDGALGPHARRKRLAAIDQAGCVLVLWSKEAQAAPILGRKTDIMTRRSLHPLICERVEASALQIV